MVFQFCAIKFLQMARLAGPTQDTTAKIQQQVKSERKREFKREETRKARPIRARWLQQCGWTAAVAAIIHSFQHGYCSSGRGPQQDQWHQAGQGRWYGPSTPRPESPHEESWTGGIAGDRELSFPKGQQQCANDQDGLSTHGDCAEDHNAFAGRYRSAEGSVETSQEYDAQRAKYQERMVGLQEAVKKAEEDFSEAKKALQAAARTTEETEVDELMTATGFPAPRGNGAEISPKRKTQEGPQETEDPLAKKLRQEVQVQCISDEDTEKEKHFG